MLDKTIIFFSLLQYIAEVRVLNCARKINVTINFFQHQIEHWKLANFYFISC